MDITHSLPWALIGGVFTLWFVLSIAAQMREGVYDRFPLLSGLGLIPRWAFFAPRPGMDDTHLLYRDRLEPGIYSEWSCLTAPESRRWFHVVWNPKKFHTKVIDDLMSSLVIQKRRIAEKDIDDRALMLTVPYIALLHFVLREPHPETATARQFVIIHNRPYSPNDEPDICFLSEFHSFSKVAKSCN